MSSPNSQSSSRLVRIAIIGRPNVGKSTLFNYLTDSRKAVVKDQPGVTRDILIERSELWGSSFEVIDTGGLTEASDAFSPLIRVQTIRFLKDVDFLLVVMDGRVGLCPEDRDVVRIAAESGKPYLIIVNKLDRVQDMDTELADFYQFGNDVVATSFERRYGLDSVLEWIHARATVIPQDESEGLRIAFTGKPNVGKSSLVNRLLGEERVLVSEVAGTTIDSVDTHVTVDGLKYTLVDTAGLRRSSRREEDLEIISSFKSQEAIRKAELILLVVDAREGPTDQDAKILASCLKSHKAVILVANKSDLADHEVPAYREHFRNCVAKEIRFFPDIPVVFVSARTGSGLKNLFNEIKEMDRKMHFHVSTRKLNDFFMQAIRAAPAPVYGTQNVKFYYLVQTKQTPPSFIAFANHPDGVNVGYRRFLAKKIQDEWDLHGVPIRIFVMRRSPRKARAPDSPITKAEIELDLIPKVEEVEWVTTFQINEE